MRVWLMQRIACHYLVDRVGSERGVGRHQEMTARRWDERSDDADQVVIHISWVPQRLRTRRHNRRDLNNTTFTEGKDKSITPVSPLPGERTKA